MTPSSLLLLLPLLGAIPAPGDDHGAASAAERAEPEFATIGQPAPDFTLTDLDGQQVTLSDLRGKIVVLEWFNPECPFVVYAHTEGPLKDQAERLAKDGVVWLSINSNAEGTQGHGADKNRAMAKDYGMTNPVLVDEDGAVGRRYEAKTTPHMYVIDAEGTLVYAGAIDNAPRGRVEGETHVNYVDAALEQMKTERGVAMATTKPYGCSVKYAN